MIIVKFYRKQNKINEILQKEFSIDKDYFFNFNATPINGSEITTRTRSFLFFTHAIILASCLNKKTNLYIPENGLISLNIPLTNTRLGSSSTRTTHPYYMKMLQSLLNLKELPKNLDSTDGLAAAVCHFYNSGSVSIGKSYSGWDAFVKQNPEKIK